jgi:hypothetical protein
MKTRGIKWCGEGDLNPHEIAPASTSSYRPRSNSPTHLDTGKNTPGET